MKKNLIVFTIVSLFSVSCFTSRQKIIEGDFYVQLFDLYKVFDAPDSVLTEIELEFAKINVDTISKESKAYVKMVKYAIDNNLLRSPYIRIKTKSGRAVMLFLNDEDYRKFDTLKCFELVEQHKKIRIKAKVKDVSYKSLKAYKSIDLIKVEKVEGVTECKK